MELFKGTLDTAGLSKKSNITNYFCCCVTNVSITYAASAQEAWQRKLVSREAAAASVL